MRYELLQETGLSILKTLLVSERVRENIDRYDGNNQHSSSRLLVDCVCKGGYAVMPFGTSSMNEIGN